MALVGGGAPTATGPVAPAAGSGGAGLAGVDAEAAGVAPAAPSPAPASLRTAAPEQVLGRAPAPASEVVPEAFADAAEDRTVAPPADPVVPPAASQAEEAAGPTAASPEASDEAIVAAPDPDTDKLLARSALLQGQMLDLSARLADMQHRVRAFEHRQYLALGEVLGECLRLRQEYLQLKAERSGAAADLDDARKAGENFDAYRRTAEEAAQAQPALDADAQDELRKLYRTAAMRCHPDRAAEADKASAHGFFVRVQEAYRARDVAALRRIVGEMKAGAESRQEAPAGSRSHAGIRARVGDLQNQVADLILAVQTLQLDRVYRQAVRIEDWDEYFAHARAKFEAECDALRAQIRALAGDGG